MKIFRKLLIFSPTCVDFSTNKISLHFLENLDKLYHDAVSLGIRLTRDLFVAVGLFSVMVWLSLDISILALTLLVITFFIRQIFYTNIYQYDVLNQKRYEISEVISRTLYHNRIIYLDQGAEQENKHIQSILKKFQHTLLKQVYRTELLKLLIFVFLIGIVTGFFYYYLQQLALNLLSVEDALTLIMAGFMLIYPLKRLFGTNLLVEKCNTELRFIFSLIDRDAEEIIQYTSITQIKYVKGELKFEEVSYKDNQNNIRLPCFNLKIILGKKISLVNPNNDINTLFADLVCGFKQPSTGKILLNNKDIYQIGYAELHSNIAWITPDKDLLSDTVAANIAYGNFRCSTEIAIITAAHASQAMEFIRKLPYGLQTRLNKCNSLLSTDQRQRILIARALLKEPSIVILDESSAYFDTNNIFLMRALCVLMSNRTVFIISSRPVLQQFADQLLDPLLPAYSTVVR
jgi:putative ABC transport system ATP-binding protein/subfamily B ATP-binding cassette protein MsbA